MKKSLILILSLILIVGCDSPLKTMDDMKDTTSEMADTTGEMNDRTAHMSETTDGMKEVTSKMYHDLRKSTAIATQELGIKGMERSESMERKIYYSVMALNSLEYTLYTGISEIGDDRIYLFDLYYEAIMNVTTLITEYSKKARVDVFNYDSINPKKEKSIKTISPATQNINKQNLLVLAYALGDISSLHKVRGRQYGVKKVGLKPMSFFDLAKKYLLQTATEENRITMNKNEIDHRFITELTQSDNKRMILNMINLRYNLFTAMVITKLSKIDKQYKKVSLGTLGLINKAKHLLKPWTASFGPKGENVYNQNQKIKLMNSYLDQALKAKNFLLQLGEKPILDKKIGGILKKMRLQRVRGLELKQFEEKIANIKK